MKNRSSKKQIIGLIGEGDQRLPVKERCRERGFSEASFYLRLRKYGGMSVSDVKRLKEIEAKDVKLKKLPAES
ncbi:MAG: IS3 family transposase, partial [Geobacteraceae bacterium]